MSEEPQREPWEKLPSGIDPERERLADERMKKLHDALAANNFEPFKGLKGSPVHTTREEIRQSLKESRESGDREPMEYDPIMDYCSM